MESSNNQRRGGQGLVAGGKEKKKEKKYYGKLLILIIFIVLLIEYYAYVFEVMLNVMTQKNFYLILTLLIIFHVLLLLLLMAFIYGLIKMKKEDFNFLKSYEFWIILLIVFVVIKIIPGVEAGDDSFYMSLFKDNANIDKINSINPRTGVVGSIDNVYLYQGFYLLMSFFSFF